MGIGILAKLKRLHIMNVKKIITKLAGAGSALTLFLSAATLSFAACHTDFLLGGSYDGIESGIGCIPTRYQDLAAWVLSIALGIGGSLAVGLIIMSGYKIMTSQGDPEKLEDAKGTLTAAISGLLFIVFSVTIYRLVAKNLLNI
jgi:hypothetical protein